MRTTVVIPDEVVLEVREHIGEQPLSRFVRAAVEERLENLRRIALLREMEAGYRDEAENPSLDPEWTAVETEGVP